MKIELVRGCICDYLGIDDIREVDMTDEQRKYYNDKISDFLKQHPQDLNYLLQDTSQIMFPKLSLLIFCPNILLAWHYL